MHRTQLLLEEDQYLQLRGEARRQNRSMGGLARDLIGEGLRARRQAAPGAPDGLGSLAGIVEDADGVAAGHDRVLNGPA